MPLNGGVSAIVPEHDGNLLITGSFSEIMARAHTSLARLILVPQLLGSGYA
jgi:hypothetical protein